MKLYRSAFKTLDINLENQDFSGQDQVLASTYQLVCHPGFHQNIKDSYNITAISKCTLKYKIKYFILWIESILFFIYMKVHR